jgi:predicted DNA-binding protein (UPF0251 family)
MAPEYRYGYGKGGGRGRRRGRRCVESDPETTLFGPMNIPQGSVEFLDLGVEHVEALRLCDILGLTQEEASEKLGISRRTLWADLKEARMKVASALMEGKGIRIIAQVPVAIKE